MIMRILGYIVDIVILLVIAAVLRLFKGQIIVYGDWLYHLCWGGLVFFFALIFLTRPRTISKRQAFPSVEIKRIADYIPQEVTQVFERWLIQCLNQAVVFLKKNQQDIKISSNHIASQIINNLKRIDTDIVYKKIERRNRDNAFIIMVFLATLIKSLSELADKKVFNKPVSPYRMIFNILNFSVAKQYMHREYYRLYELGTIVQGDWGGLNFNHDIEGILRAVFCQNNNTAIVSASLDELDQSQSHVDITPPIQSVEKCIAISLKITHQSVSKMIITFNKWLKKVSLQHCTNQDDLFFQDSSSHNFGGIFISDKGFDEFNDSNNITKDAIKQQLFMWQLTDNLPYQLVLNNGDIIKLTKIMTTVSSLVKTHLNGKIEVLYE